jgi:hypothetical protein
MARKFIFALLAAGSVACSGEPRNDRPTPFIPGTVAHLVDGSSPYIRVWEEEGTLFSKQVPPECGCEKQAAGQVHNTTPVFVQPACGLS